MADWQEVLTRIGLGGNSTGKVNQGAGKASSAQDTSRGGHWWNRLFGHGTEDEAPPPELPEKLKPPSAWDLARTGVLDNMKVGRDEKGGYRTLGDMTNILFNENRALSGGDTKRGFAGDERLREAKHAMAHAIINNTVYMPSQVASPVISKKTRGSPEYKRDYPEAQSVMRNAFADQMTNFEDPVRGRSQYNHRVTGSIGERLVGKRKDPTQSVFAHYGPFPDSYKHNRQWIVIYNPSAVPGYEEKGRNKNGLPMAGESGHSIER